MQGTVARDRFMAENVRWLLETEHPREKIVLWAHNSHVATAPVAGGKSLGMHLRETYGRHMVVLGFGAHHGTVRAMRMQDGSFIGGGPVALDLAPAIASSIEGLFRGCRTAALHPGFSQSTEGWTAGVLAGQAAAISLDRSGLRSGPGIRQLRLVGRAGQV